jgi:hypothetical protein
MVKRLRRRRQTLPEPDVTDSGDPNGADEPLAPEPERAGPLVTVRWPVLLAALGLLVAAVGLVLHNLDLLPEDVLRWWPLALLLPAALWFLGALFRRRPRGLLRSTAALGVAASLFLAAQNVAPVGATLVGVTFISVGAGLLLRGLLLRNQAMG